MAYGIQVRDADGVMRDLDATANVRSFTVIADVIYHKKDTVIELGYTPSRGANIAIVDTLVGWDMILNILDTIKTYWKIEGNTIRFSEKEISSNFFLTSVIKEKRQGEAMAFLKKMVIEYV